jgi:hypothetical protein
MRVRGCVAPLIVAVTLAACASETQPLDPDSVPLPQPAPKSLVAPLSRAAPKSLTQQSIPWRHLPQPVSDEELKLDNAKCTLAGKMVSSTGPPEMKFNLVFADCMRSKGYESI